jgi:hypothetical protein
MFRNENPPSPENKYIPSVEQEKRLVLLKQVVAQFEAAGIHYSVMGGYGLDGLYGELTRDHGDIDMVLDPKDLEKTRLILSQLGFELKTREARGKEVYIHTPTETKLEFGTLDMLAQFTKEGEYIILSEGQNANLEMFSFRTAPLEGHEILHKIQAKRAEEGEWGKYPHSESRNALVEKIQNKQKEKIPTGNSDE